MKAIWIIVVLVCGGLLPLQGGFNSRLGKWLESPLYAALLCFFIGAVTIALLLPFSKQSLSLPGLKSVPLLLLLGGGFTGAAFITGTMLAVPRLGVTLTFGLVIAGQIIISLLLDHYKIMVVEQHSINYWRLLGVGLIISGVFLVQKF